MQIIDKGSRVIDYKAILLQLCIEYNTPLSHCAYWAIMSGDITRVFSYDVSPDLYTDPEHFRRDLQIVNLLKKSPIFSHSDCEQTAYKTYIASEDRCRKWNTSFYENNMQLPILGFSPEVLTLANQARDIFQGILGSLSKRDLNYFEKSCNFGPGSTKSTGHDVSLGAKFHLSRIDGTRPAINAFLFNSSLWSKSVETLEITAHSKLTFVPKDFKTHRAIEVQPHLNIFYQKGVGSLLRRKLKSAGLDLDSCHEINKSLALAGSLNGSFATIDLASASDSISYGLISWLLFGLEDWKWLLEFCRVPCVRYANGDSEKLHRLEKWSAMGNGYTFELESLIFYSIAKAVSGNKTCSVFGDDIIVENSLFHITNQVLELLGFSINLNKSFGSSCFRESCGGNFFNGIDVTPLRLKGAERFSKKNFNHFLFTIFGIYNGMKRCKTSHFLPSLIYNQTPKAFRFVSPLTRDGGFHLPPNKPRLFGMGGNFFPLVNFRSDRKGGTSYGSYISFLKGNISKFGKGFNPQRGFGSYEIKAAFCSLELEDWSS